jgi:hypothetical protein
MILHVKLISFLLPWRVLRLLEEESNVKGTEGTIVARILHKQSRRADKAWQHNLLMELSPS